MVSSAAVEPTFGEDVEQRFAEGEGVRPAQRRPGHQGDDARFGEQFGTQGAGQCGDTGPPAAGVGHAHLPEHAVHQCFEHGCPVRVVGVHGRRHNAEPAGDAADGHTVGAAFADERHGGVEELVLGERPAWTWLRHGTPLTLHTRHWPPAAGSTPAAG
jgi:hypothetical protein